MVIKINLTLYKIRCKKLNIYLYITPGYLYSANEEFKNDLGKYYKTFCIIHIYSTKYRTTCALRKYNYVFIILPIIFSV